MSTIKSQDEDLTLNAHGSGNDIKFQSNGSEVASIDQAGVVTATSFAGSGAALTGVGVDGISSSADATAITIDSAENVGFGSAPTSFYSGYTGLQLGGNGAFYGQTSAGADKNLWLSQNARAGTDGSEKAISTGTSSQIMMSSGNVTLKTGASASADANVTWTTGFEVLADGKARAKNGLLFGTDTAAANALDDYEEGSWTPAFTGHQGSAGSVAHSVQEAFYTKIGRLVTCQFKMILSNRGSWSGEVRLTGLPFTASETLPAAGSVSLHQVNIPGDASGHDVYIDHTVSYFRFYYTQDFANRTFVQVNQVTDAARFDGTISYIV